MRTGILSPFCEGWDSFDKYVKMETGMYNLERKTMNQWECLRMLLEQNHFELIGFESVTPEKDGTDCRLIYLMNDAVESFLVFRDARYTGTYQENYDGDLHYALLPEENCIRVDQGDSHLLLFFDELEMETHFYDYGQVGHFWVKGYEDLRVLEYQIAIIADKLEYLGEDACNPLERRIASLKHFPPLNYTCYPSASSDYVFPMEDPWQVSGEALDFMEEICREAEDRGMCRRIRQYRRNPSTGRARRIARQLSRPGHRQVTEVLRNRIRQAAALYPRRSYGVEEDSRIKEKLRRAEQACQRYRKKGICAWAYREEPFVCGGDDLRFQVYVLTVRRGILRRRIQVLPLEEAEGK